MKAKTCKLLIQIYVWTSIIVAVVLSYHLVYKWDILGWWMRLGTGK